jgi:hypothetical protein
VAWPRAKLTKIESTTLGSSVLFARGIARFDDIGGAGGVDRARA